VDASRGWILAALLATLLGLVFALAPASRGEAPSPEVAPAAPTAEPRTESAAVPLPSREPLAEPPRDARAAEQGPQLLTGRLVDDLGQPAGGARVAAAFAAPPPDGAWSADEQRAQVAAGSMLAVRQLDEGYFEVRGWTEAAWIRVTARDGGRRSSGRWKVGARDVRLVLPRTGSVEALLLHDPSVMTSSFDVSLRRGADAPPIALELGRLQVLGERRCAALEVPVGDYSFEVRLRGYPTPLLRLDGIAVRPKERCADERLQRIDVRGLCRRIVVRLLRPDGLSLPLPAFRRAAVEALDPHGAPLLAPPVLARSQIELLTTFPYVDLRVELRGYRAVHLPLLSADCAVHLDPSADGDVPATEAR
jgi:hypothetical protein